MCNKSYAACKKSQLSAKFMTKKSLPVSIIWKGFLFFHMKLYVQLDFACQHKKRSDADACIYCISVFIISRMPQQEKHRRLQNGCDFCPSAEMLFFCFVKFPVFTVHRAERPYDSCRSSQRKYHCRIGHPDKQAFRIYRYEQHKA